jgi:MFS family permease
LWYPRKELQYRVGLFFGAASLAGAFSGLLAFGISFMSGKRGLLGWSWIFVCFSILMLEEYVYEVVHSDIGRNCYRYYWTYRSLW